MDLRLLACCTTVAITLAGFSSARSQQLTRVTECVSPSPSVYCIWVDPQISPDGNWIAYTSGSTWPPYYEWWPSIAVVSVDGTSNLPIMNASLNNWAFNPVWSPNGTHLAFVVSGYSSGDHGIWVADLTDPTNIDSYRQLPNTAGAYGLAWSRDGQSIAFTGNGGIWVAEVAGTAANLLIPGGREPSWAYDGAIVFVQMGDLWIREAHGSVRQLTDTPYRESSPAWSPAGTWIAYTCDRYGTWDIHVTAPSGGTPVRITSGAADETFPSWSGDSKSLLFHSYLQNDEFWLATDLPDFTVSVAEKHWGQVKQIYR